MTKSPYPRAAKLLKKFGIDPRVVMLESINSIAYSELQLDADGNRVRDNNGNIVWRRVAWPKDPATGATIGHKVMRALKEDRAEAVGSDEVPADTLNPSPPLRALSSVPIMDKALLARCRYDMNPSEENLADLEETHKVLTDDEAGEVEVMYRKMLEENPITREQGAE
jgi:hypothetical protein